MARTWSEFFPLPDGIEPARGPYDDQIHARNEWTAKQRRAIVALNIDVLLAKRDASELDPAEWIALSTGMHFLIGEQDPVGLELPR